MDRYRETGQVDPDYESYNSAVELNEEEGKHVWVTTIFTKSVFF